VGSWRKFHNKIRKIYTSPNTTRVINSKRVRLTMHAEGMSKLKYGLFGKSDGRRPL
jgi:hypothetical protein